MWKYLYQILMRYILNYTTYCELFYYYGYILRYKRVTILLDAFFAKYISNSDILSLAFYFAWSVFFFFFFLNFIPNDYIPETLHWFFITIILLYYRTVVIYYLFYMFRMIFKGGTYFIAKWNLKQKTFYTDVLMNLNRIYRIN